MARALLPHLAIGEPTQIERLGGIAPRGVIGIDGGGELAHGRVVLTRRQGRGSVLQSGILGVEPAPNRHTDGERRGKTARAREAAPAESKTARPEVLPIIRHVLAKQRNRANPRLSLFDCDRLRQVARLIDVRTLGAGHV